jgi:hypothetical protein
MRLLGHVALFGEIRSAHKILVGNPDGRTSLGRLGEDGRIILKWTLNKIVLEGVDWIRLTRHRPVTGSCELGNECWSSVKDGEFPDCLMVLLTSQETHCCIEFVSFYSRHQIACLKIAAKSYNIARRIAEPRRVKTAQNSQHSKASNAVLVT